MASRLGKNCFLAMLLINLCSLLSEVQGAPLATANSVLPQQRSSYQQQQTNCPVQSLKALLHSLGDKKRSLQPFSPVPLCRGALARSVTNNDYHSEAEVAGGQQRQPSPSNTLESSVGNYDIDNIPGCTADDIAQLMVLQPDITSPCQWRIKCKYSPDRFPHILYQAEESRDRSQMPCSCLPIQREVWRLRQTTRNNCTVWSTKPRRELLTVSYNCQVGDM